MEQMKFGVIVAVTGDGVNYLLALERPILERKEQMYR